MADMSAERFRTAIVVKNVCAVDLGIARPKPTTSSPGQVEADQTFWSAEGSEVGVWEASPGTFSAARIGYHEVCQILAGSATITGDDGVVYKLSAGDLFVTPAGWRGTWVVHEKLRKVFIIQTHS